MEYISIIGILAGIAIFVFMAIKKLPLYLAAIVATTVVAVFSALDPFTAVSDTFMSGMAGLIKSYFLLFIAGGVFGKAMDNTGCARKIALSLAQLTRKSRNQGFWITLTLPVFYLILTYVGISGFVIVFTMMQVARDLFSEGDVPWRFFTYGSSGIVAGTVLGGTMSTTNVMVTSAFGVPLTAGFGVSLVFAVVYMAVLAVLIYLDNRRCAKAGEGFLPSGRGIMEASSPARNDDELPSLGCAVAPLVFPILVIVFFQLSAVITLLLATAVCLLLNGRRVKDLRGTLVEGFGSAILSAVNVAAANGFATVIRGTAGFATIAALLQGLPGLFPVVVLGMGMTAAVGSSTSWVNAFLPTLMEWMAPLGLSAGLCARLIPMSCITMMVPHNPGPVNAVSFAKLDVGPAVRSYLKGSLIPGAAALAVCIALIYAGVFV